MKRTQVDQVLDHYPKIFLACHARHVRDPEDGEHLSSHQASILDHLDEADPLTLAALARHMGVTPGTMSVAIDRLVQLGYVLRARDEADGRRVNLRLSASGLRIRNAQSVLDRDLVARLLARLTPEERKRSLEGLALLARAAGEIQREKSERGAWHRAPSSRTQSDGA